MSVFFVFCFLKTVKVIPIQRNTEAKEVRSLVLNFLAGTFKEICTFVLSPDLKEIEADKRKSITSLLHINRSLLSSHICQFESHLHKLQFVLSMKFKVD